VALAAQFEAIRASKKTRKKMQAEEEKVKRRSSTPAKPRSTLSPWS